MKVEVAHVRVSRAFVNVDAGDENVRPISEPASMTKIALVRTENISSVKRVRYFTRCDAEVTEDKSRSAEVQSPVHP